MDAAVSAILIANVAALEQLKLQAADGGHAVRILADGIHLAQLVELNVLQIPQLDGHALADVVLVLGLHVAVGEEVAGVGQTVVGQPHLRHLTGGLHDDLELRGALTLEHEGLAIHPGGQIHRNGRHRRQIRRRRGGPDGLVLDVHVGVFVGKDQAGGGGIVHHRRNALTLGQPQIQPHEGALPASFAAEALHIGGILQHVVDHQIAGIAAVGGGHAQLVPVRAVGVGGIVLLPKAAVALHQLVDAGFHRHGHLGADGAVVHQSIVAVGDAVVVDVIEGVVAVLAHGQLEFISDGAFVGQAVVVELISTITAGRIELPAGTGAVTLLEGHQVVAVAVIAQLVPSDVGGVFHVEAGIHPVAGIVVLSRSPLTLYLEDDHLPPGALEIIDDLVGTACGIAGAVRRTIGTDGLSFVKDPAGGQQIVENAVVDAHGFVVSCRKLSRILILARLQPEPAPNHAIDGIIGLAEGGFCATGRIGANLGFVRISLVMLRQCAVIRHIVFGQAGENLIAGFLIAFNGIEPVVLALIIQYIQPQGAEIMQIHVLNIVIFFKEGGQSGGISMQRDPELRSQLCIAFKPFGGQNPEAGIALIANAVRTGVAIGVVHNSVLVILGYNELTDIHPFAVFANLTLHLERFALDTRVHDLLTGATVVFVCFQGYSQIGKMIIPLRNPYKIGIGLVFVISTQIQVMVGHVKLVTIQVKARHRSRCIETHIGILAIFVQGKTAGFKICLYSLILTVDVPGIAELIIFPRRIGPCGQAGKVVMVIGAFVIFVGHIGDHGDSGIVFINQLVVILGIRIDGPCNNHIIGTI